MQPRAASACSNNNHTLRMSPSFIFRIITLVMAVILTPMTSHAAPRHPRPQSIPQEYQRASKHSFTSGTHVLPYRCFMENMERAGAPHLLLLLHGRSGSGYDNTAQLSSPALPSLLEYVKRHRIKCIILLPQCSPEQDWLSSGALDTAVQLAQKMSKRYNINKQNCCISGVSMGGRAAYEAMLRQPRVFSKCLVVAGSAHANKIHQAKGDFYIVHGEYDRTIPLERALQTEQALRSNPRNNVKLRILPQMQHINSCLSGYDTTAWKWAFSPTNRKKGREEK